MVINTTRLNEAIKTAAGIFLLLLAAAVAGCSGPEEKAKKEKHAYTPPRWNNLVHERFYDPAARAAHEEVVADTPRDPTLTWEEELAFFTRLQKKTRASMLDAVRAVALSVDLPGLVEDDEELDDLIADLNDRKILHPACRIDDRTPLTKGRIAYMICQAYGLRGGLWMNLFGPNERYCLKEAMYHDIIRTGSLHKYISGVELLDILAQADCFRMDKPGLAGLR